MRTEPTLEHEAQYWSQGIRLVAGVDEAGMGALAGPVVAAAVVFDSGEFSKLNFSRRERDPAVAGQFSDKSQAPNPQKTPPLRDSKTLSAKQREAAAEWIKSTALAWAVGEASVAEITELNILRASHLAMRRAVAALSHPPALLLIDGRPAEPHEHIPAVCLIGGDHLSCSIAAASVLAKTHRDAQMRILDEQYPGYGLAAHKGYGSAAHLAALRERGATPIHRPTYAPVANLTAGR